MLGWWCWVKLYGFWRSSLAMHHDFQMLGSDVCDVIGERQAEGDGERSKFGSSYRWSSGGWARVDAC